MRYLYKFGEELFWTGFWVFLVLVVGFFILNKLSSNYSGSFIGTDAAWVAAHASNQYGA